MRRAILFLVIISTMACTKEEFCITPNAVAVTLSFKTYDSTNILVDTVLNEATVFNTDTSYLFADFENFSAIAVPLNSKLSKQSYIIEQDVYRDTIVLSYITKENFISNGCGFQTIFELQKVSHSTHAIDSVNITNISVIPNPEKAHLEVIIK